MHDSVADRGCVQVVCVLRGDFCGHDLERWKRLRRVLAASHRQDEENAQVGLTLVMEAGPLRDVMSRYLRTALGESCHLEFMTPGREDPKASDVCYRQGVWWWRFEHKPSGLGSDNSVAILEREYRELGPEALARLLASVDLSDFDPTDTEYLVG